MDESKTQSEKFLVQCPRCGNVYNINEDIFHYKNFCCEAVVKQAVEDLIIQYEHQHLVEGINFLLSNRYISRMYLS